MIDDKIQELIDSFDKMYETAPLVALVLNMIGKNVNASLILGARVGAVTQERFFRGIHQIVC